LALDAADWSHDGSALERYWYAYFVPVFLELYLLPVTAALTVIVIVTNPMGFDWRQRITGGAALVFASYFVAHTVHKTAKAPDPPPPKNIERTAETPAPASPDTHKASAVPSGNLEASRTDTLHPHK
jgi:hypothetical protein